MPRKSKTSTDNIKSNTANGVSHISIGSDDSSMPMKQKHQSMFRQRNAPGRDSTPTKRNAPDAAVPGRFPLSQEDDDTILYQQPRALLRGNFALQQKRSRSQPLCQHRNQSANSGTVMAQPIMATYIDDYMDENFAVDYERPDIAIVPSTSYGFYDQANLPPRRRRHLPRSHLSRADRFSIDSEAGNSSQDSGIRSSMHSNSSSNGSGEGNTGQNDKYPQNKSSTTSSSYNPSSMLMVEAIWDHVAMLADELPFANGDIITVLDASSNSGLWYGMCRDSTGWFPASYVRVKTAVDFPKRLSSNSFSSSTNSGELSEDVDALIEEEDELTAEEFPQQMRFLRRKIVEELLETERDYVQLLQNLVQGFLEQCRRRSELFGEERTNRIFGNIEQLVAVHTKLLREMEMCFDQTKPERTCLATVFLRNSPSFSVYTEYCNNRPVSCAELAILEQTPQFHHFFEACRLLRGMPKLSLEGFLLTPVQRVCRYPLQLFELLKATPHRHPDRNTLEHAHKTMRAVAAHINDAKRRMDAIQKIILWQKNVHGFRGPDLVDNNHRMLISGEMHCRALMRQGSAGSVVQWSKTVHVYLFDQSIVLCKKDVLKKNSLVFKERMSLQSTSVNDLHDGKEPATGANLKNSFKLSGPTREYIFTSPDPATKGLWLEALRTRPRPSPPSTSEKRLALITLNYN
ncbi:rhoGEF domain-containing protein [Ditylenchus destructor]|uniref:RhoGEF domain-containing protein n=1 Tax=Ditylenchus destructor TaxID=166010 RepID=A0AAD4QZC1_9BILA|nr:rhoGEF domain-containing protein [Ditylenchus destructor]